MAEGALSSGNQILSLNQSAKPLSVDQQQKDVTLPGSANDSQPCQSSQLFGQYALLLSSLASSSSGGGGGSSKLPLPLQLGTGPQLATTSLVQSFSPPGLCWPSGSQAPPTQSCAATAGPQLESRKGGAPAVQPGEKSRRLRWVGGWVGGCGWCWITQLRQCGSSSTDSLPAPTSACCALIILLCFLADGGAA